MPFEYVFERNPLCILAPVATLPKKATDMFRDVILELIITVENVDY
jgi:hypothetical protein